MATADDASTLRRRRPPVVRINLEPTEDASDSAQSSPRAAAASYWAQPFVPSVQAALSSQAVVPSGGASVALTAAASTARQPPPRSSAAMRTSTA